ncbi:MAG: hypothetical protein EOP84_18980 [Verrucomicrobiaceae bacterium]|nr:MAG: hypothetical protein EOP84_18980 [Verrucomicrobiaceae bacterium]
MKTVALLGLTLVFAFCAGLVAELAVPDFITHAQYISGGKPLPVLTSWIFRHLTSGGAIFCIFVIPWALLLASATCLVPADRCEGHCSRCALLYYAVLFMLAEMVLCLVFGFAALMPYSPGWHRHGSDEVHGSQLIAFLPQILLLLIFAAAVIIPIYRIVRRRFRSGGIDA